MSGLTERVDCVHVGPGPDVWLGSSVLENLDHLGVEELGHV
jgi:hypothetical protein